MLTRSDLSAIGNLFDQKFEEKFEPVRKEMKIIKRDIKRIFHHIDIHDLEVDRRLKNLESHPNLKLQQF